MWVCVHAHLHWRLREQYTREFEDNRRICYGTGPSPLDPERKISAGVFSGVDGRGRPKPKTLLADHATNIDGAERSQEQLDVLVEQWTVVLGSLVSQVQVASLSRIHQFLCDTCGRFIHGTDPIHEQHQRICDLVLTKIAQYYVFLTFSTLSDFADSIGLLSFDLDL